LDPPPCSPFTHLNKLRQSLADLCLPVGRPGEPQGGDDRVEELELLLPLLLPLLVFSANLLPALSLILLLSQKVFARIFR